MCACIDQDFLNIHTLFSMVCSQDACFCDLDVKWLNSCQEWPKITYFFPLPASNAMARAPLSISRGMEQLRGAVRGTESPGHQDRISPQEREERGESLLYSGALLNKSSCLELNGSPAAPGTRQNGTPLRPLGGGGQSHKLNVVFAETFVL